MYLLRITTGILLLLAWTSTASAVDSSRNAALAYWQAFAQLPPTDKEQDKILRGPASDGLNEVAQKLIEKSKGSMDALRRGSSMPECHWGLEFEAGPLMVMPHLSKARELARFARLSARRHFADGDVEAAIKVLGDTLVLARRSGSDDVLISLLVQYAMEELVMDAIAYHLPNMDADQIDLLGGGLDALPEGGSMMACLKMEQEMFVGWARRTVEKATSDEEAVRMLRSAIINPKEDDEPDPSVTREQMAKWLDGTSQDYEEVFDIFQAPDDEFNARWNALVDRVREDNPFSAMVLPALGRIRNVRDKNAVQWALFRAATKIVRDGEGARATLKDPFGNGPFQYEKLDSGFRLTSKLMYRDEAVSLTIGN